MKIRRKKVQVKGERDGPLTLSRITHLTGRKTRNLAPVDPEAKKRKRKANTSQRRAINPKAAAKAERKAGDQEAETSLTSIKVMEKGVAQRAKPKMTTKKRLRLTTAKRETKAMTLISTERKPKEETGRKAGQSPKARKEPPKMDPDPQALPWIDLLCQRRLRKIQKRAEREAENAVEKGGTTVTESIRGGELPGRRNIEQGAETETRPEIHREAGGPEVGATEETAAEIGHLIEGTEKAQPTEDGEAQTATGAREKGAAGAPIPEGAGGTARPETDVVLQDQTVQKAKKGRDPDPAPAPALTVTDIPKLRKQKFASLFQHAQMLNFI